MLAEELAAGKVRSVVTGSDTRAGSVRAALAEIPDEAAVIVVHDAARPLVTDDVLGRVHRAAVRGLRRRGAGAARRGHGEARRAGRGGRDARPQRARACRRRRRRSSPMRCAARPPARGRTAPRSSRPRAAGSRRLPATRGCQGHVRRGSASWWRRGCEGRRLRPRRDARRRDGAVGERRRCGGHAALHADGRPRRPRRARRGALARLGDPRRRAPGDRPGPATASTPMRFRRCGCSAREVSSSERSATRPSRPRSSFASTSTSSARRRAGASRNRLRSSSRGSSTRPASRRRRSRTSAIESTTTSYRRSRPGWSPCTSAAARGATYTSRRSPRSAFDSLVELPQVLGV